MGCMQKEKCYRVFNYIRLFRLGDLVSLGRFIGTWIKHFEIKMFIATRRNSSGETWSNLRDCERFIQSDLLKSSFSNEVMGGLIHLACYIIVLLFQECSSNNLYNYRGKNITKN